MNRFKTAVGIGGSTVSTAVKLTSVALTLGFLGAAVAIGAGAPLSPARIASVATEATDNLAIAQRNISEASEDTEALATIEENVQSQLDTSRRLLDTQLGIEESSTEGVQLSRTLAGRIGDVGSALGELVDRLRGVASVSGEITSSAEAADAAANELESTLDELIDRYEVAVDESRKLNRKARAFEELKP
jgi:methyl-accepting chemotaxis protein